MDSTKAEISQLFQKKFTDPPRLASEIIQKIKNGEAVDDREFDSIFPPYYGVVSSVHWSPIEVARQIAEWLGEKPTLRLVDIGCGVGKLCLLLRLLTHHQIHGIEQRENFVTIAREIIETNGFFDVSVKHLNMLDLEWSKFDVYYLYNPFQEHQIGSGIGVIEPNIDLDLKYFAQYTSEVFRQLSWAEKGKLLISFHGFGGRMPSSWKIRASKNIENGQLELWEKET